MSLLTDSRASAAFKLSQRRAHTHNNRQFFNESFESSYVVLAQDIWANKLPKAPNDAITEGLVAPVTLRLYNILSPDATPVVNAYKTVFFWGDQSASTQSLLTGKINPRTGTLYSDAVFNAGLSSFGNGSEGTAVNGGARTGHVIPEIINIADSNLVTPASGGYRPILKNYLGTRIFPLDAADWFLDTFAGIVVQETDGSILNLNGPNNNGNATQHATLECFIYIGSMVSDVVGISGAGGSSIDQNDLDSLQSLLEAQIDANTSLITPLSGDILSLRTDVDSISAQLGNIGNVSGLQTKIDSLSASIDGVSSNLTISIDDVNGKIASISGSIDSVASNLVTTNSNVSTNTGNISGLQTNTAEISANFADKRTENTFQENATFLKNVTINGTLNIPASGFDIVQANQISTSGAFFIVNDGETGSGITSGKAGIRVDRGQSQDARLIFDEDGQSWKIGLSGSENIVATRSNDPVVQGALVLGNDADNYTQDNNLTFDGSKLNIVGDLSVQSISADGLVVGGSDVITELSLANKGYATTSYVDGLSGTLTSSINAVQSNVESLNVNLTSTISSISASLNNKIDSEVSALTSLIASTSGSGGGGGDVDNSTLQAVSGNLQGQIDVLSTSIIAGASGVIGNAEDGDYSDGLFVDFVPTTPIGTAVDRFNELFLALAPSPPPSMDNINLNITSETGKISYGSDNNLAQYREAGVGVKNTVVNNIIANATTFTGVINDDISSNASHPANVFGNAKTGVLSLVVDGVEVATMDLTTSNNAIDNTSGGSVSGFNVSAVAYAELNGTPLSADLFAYRTGTFTVKQTDFQDGNFGFHTIQVIHSTGGTSNVESMNIDADITAINFSGQTISTINTGSTKYISGIQYYTDLTLDFGGGTVLNAYRNSYSSAANAISWIGTNVNTETAILPILGAGEVEDKTLSSAELDNASMVINPSSGRLLNETVSVQLQIKKTLGRTASASPSVSQSILMDTISDNSTNLVENFNGELFRLAEGNVSFYGSQNDWSGNGGAGRKTGTEWDSTDIIGSGLSTHSNGMLIANGRLSYPSNTTDISNVANGDFSTAIIGSGPNYSALSGERTFYRYFFFGAAANVSNFSFRVTSTPSITIIDSDAVFGGSTEYKVEILAPGEAIVPAATPVLQFNDASKAWGDDNGIYNAGGSSGEWRAVTFGSVGVKVIVMKVTVPSNFSGKISKLEVQL